MKIYFNKIIVRDNVRKRVKEKRGRRKEIV